NKILILVDEGVKIQDYNAVAKYVFSNLNPVSDIYFSQGPMDVLDHSCSKLGFGGKMCIDGTKKFPEESYENYESKITNYEFDSAALLNKFSEIKAINFSLLKKEIPCLIISVQKNRKGHIRELHEQICSLKELEGVKLILYVEHTVDANDLPTALWRFCNNLDPKRDHVLYKQKNICMGFDGTRKTKEFDDFNRDWPNIIIADDATINAVDAKWNELGIGSFISSPSLKFKEQIYGEEAVVQ
ncbi:MAG TPA: menaquinone biosynthesis decarboxylase, partial [Chitinophagaceae bacterium]|nr:menaquinone biosynthesis decarboxylase [Chitinophagaceae bacterium]